MLRLLSGKDNAIKRMRRLSSFYASQTHGDDYLFVPRNPEKKQAIEDLLIGENLIWEIVDSLPNHIQLHK